ncbi:hypothetical protein MRX96_040092 [Rhipicephalus microplus]
MYVPTYATPVASYPVVPAVAAVQTVHQVVPPTHTVQSSAIVHNVPTPYGYRTTGVSHTHRVDVHPGRAHILQGLLPYGLNYGYGLDAFGYPTVLKKW